MIVGFNHNILYLGVGFHVQTEDGGLKSPSLVTLLYHGGIIVSSQKTSYADILGVDNLNQVVEDLAKEQHKGMLRRLTKGEFDERIRALGIEIEGGSAAGALAPAIEEEVPTAAAEPEDAPVTEADVSAAGPDTPADKDEASWLVEELEELEPVPLGLVAKAESETPDTEVSIATPPAAELPAEPTAIQPAYEPPSAADRGTLQDVSQALDDLIFSYLTGGDETS